MPARLPSQAAKAVKAEPANLQSRRDLADAYFRTGKVDQAREQLKAALGQSPGDPASVLALSSIEVAQKHPEAAAAVLADAIKAKPESIQIRALEVQLLMSQKKLDAAEKRARDAVQAVTDKASATELLARVLAAEAARRVAVPNREHVHVRTPTVKRCPPLSIEHLRTPPPAPTSIRQFRAYRRRTGR